MRAYLSLRILWLANCYFAHDPLEIRALLPFCDAPSGRSFLPYGQKNRPGRCHEPEIIALRTLMTNQAREVFCQGRFPASLIYVLIVSPSPAAPSTLMPLPSRSTSAGRPAAPDIARLPLSSFSPPFGSETRPDSLYPGASIWAQSILDSP
jgi:hypothetical protein